MAQTSYPFDGTETSESQYTVFFRELQDTGVVPTTASALAVSTDGSTLKVRVQPGMAIIRGHVYRSSSVEEITLKGGTSAARIDTVVLRLDPNSNSILLDVVQGPTSGAPTPQSLTQTEAGIYEFPLADVLVPANATLLQTTATTDRRVPVGERTGRWSDALRPREPRKGKLGFNESSGLWEFYDGTKWVDLVSWATLGGRPTTSTNDGRNIYVQTTAPAASLGRDGDVCFVAVV